MAPRAVEIMPKLTLKSIGYAALGTFALGAGALFAFSRGEDSRAHIEIGGASLIASIAATPEQRARGLGGIGTLAEDSGMFFLFDRVRKHQMRTQGVRVPLDIFWINNGAVVDMQEHVPVFDRNVPDALLPVYAPSVPAQYVLETRAGFAGRHGIRKGSEVRVSLPGAYAAIVAGVGQEVGSDDRSDSPTDALSARPYFVSTLREHPLPGSSLKIGSRLASPADYKKYAISYQAGPFTISGIMNVPSNDQPDGGFPIIILNHGLIPKEKYFSGRGSKREQEFFTRHGYVTIHPDYRGLASSTPDPAMHHDFYIGYAQDVIALIDALKAAKQSFINVEKIGMWGHSMGGGVIVRAMILRPDIKAYVLFAPVSADAEDNFFELDAQEVAWLRAAYGEEGGEVYKKISPLTYFDDVTAPVQLHHGLADNKVPIAFSRKMYNALRSLGKSAELFTYPAEKHEFIDAWPLAAERSLQFFNRHVRGM